MPLGETPEQQAPEVRKTDSAKQRRVDASELNGFEDFERTTVATEDGDRAGSAAEQFVMAGRQEELREGVVDLFNKLEADGRLAVALDAA